jgi:transcriptional antiterminator RfaH
VAFWAVAQLQPRHEVLALHCLALAGFETYLPRLRVRRVSSHRRRIEAQPPLFPGYAFLLVELQWHAALRAPGTCGLIMDGMMPARVPDRVIAEIRRREVRGLIELPKRGLQRGDSIRILQGPFSGRLAIFADMKAHERVEVLLSLLGGARSVTMPRQNVEAV